MNKSKKTQTKKSKNNKLEALRNNSHKKQKNHSKNQLEFQLNRNPKIVIIQQKKNYNGIKKYKCYRQVQI